MYHSTRQLSCFILLGLMGCAEASEPPGQDREQGDGRHQPPESAQDSGVDSNRTSPELVSLSIEPTLAELLAENGARPEQVFSVRGTLSSGETVAVPSATFTLSRRELGTIGRSGKFVASGIAGGEAEVRVVAATPNGKNVSATATIKVSLKRDWISADVPPDGLEKFQQTPTASPAANLVYPLEGAVMPQNVFPAEVQWLAGAAGDLFELRMEKPSAKFRAVLRHSGATFKNSYPVESTAWRMLAQSDPTAPVVMTLTRWDSATGQLVQSPAVSFSFARAALTGSVYYWDIQAGRIQRIDDGTNVAVNFMPNPPTGANAQQTCVGCHSVSPSGRYMAGRLGSGINTGAVFDLTTDLTLAPAPSIFSPKTSVWWFSTWSPDETRLMVSRGPGNGPSLALIDAMTGTDIPVTGTLPSNATQPAWSPDGKEIAYVANGNNWGDNAVLGDIAVLPITGRDQVGTPRTIHTGTSLSGQAPGGSADSYPSFSPDSKSIVFAHGTGSRSDTQQGALYMMGRDGSHLVRLDKACGGAGAAYNYQPRFSPFDSGDHFWISFLSRRDYGNTLAGTRGTSRQQIWVAAIRKDGKLDEDPSEVGYWLPGQKTTSKNISAYWAPRACRKDGEGCSVGSECCGGDCRPDENDVLVCSPPTAEECRTEGQTCSSDSDCCGGLPCSNNVCIAPIVVQ